MGNVFTSSEPEIKDTNSTPNSSRKLLENNSQTITHANSRHQRSLSTNSDLFQECSNLQILVNENNIEKNYENSNQFNDTNDNKFYFVSASPTAQKRRNSFDDDPRSPNSRISRTPVHVQFSNSNS